MPSSRRFVLLDRDGTVNVEVDYLSDPDKLALYPGVGAALRRLQGQGFGLVVVTNQSGIARRRFDLAALDRVHVRLREILAEEGVTLDGIYYCPHAPEDGCDCRKPLPGMVEQAVADHDFDPERSFLVGDKRLDVLMAQAVGATGILVRTGYGAQTEADGKVPPGIVVVDDLTAAAAFIEQSAGSTAP